MMGHSSVQWLSEEGRSTVGGDSWTGGTVCTGGGGAGVLSQPGFTVDIVSLMVNAVFQQQARSAARKTLHLLPQKARLPLRVLAGHLDCDGLHLRVLLQAALPSAKRTTGRRNSAA